MGIVELSAGFVSNNEYAAVGVSSRHVAEKVDIEERRST